MSTGRSFVVIAALACAGAAAVAPGCTPDYTACTPQNSGFSDQRRLTRRDLTRNDQKQGCSPHLAAIRSDAELRRAYVAAGMPVIDPDAGGMPTADAVALPSVDWSTETVIVREASNSRGVTWIVAKDTLMTVGTQGCINVPSDVCVLEIFAVDAVGTQVAEHVCDDVGCG